MSRTPRLPAFSRQMCQVLRKLLDTECFFYTYAAIAEHKSESEDMAFANEVKTLKDYFEERAEHMKTIEQVTQQQRQRITCESTGRLIATVNEQGITVWCKYQKQAEFVSWETLDALRAKCERVLGEQSEAC